MTTASLRRRCPCSPAASPLDDNNLLCEILLRLPPQPSSLPRASAVCKRWRRLVADPDFFRRFRLHHYRNLPLLGFFNGSNGLTFVPTLKSPNRVHPRRFSMPPTVDDCFQCLGCRHGLVLIFLRTRVQVLVWDPVTGDQHRFAIPRGIARYAGRTLINGAVLRAAGDLQHFQVVLTMTDGDQQHTRALAWLYSSQTGLWGNLVSVPLPYKPNGCLYPTFIDTIDAVLAGDSLYWVLVGNSDRILEFDLGKQSLDVIQVPADMCGDANHVRIMRAEGGGLGVLLVSSSYYTLQLWKRKTDCDGVTSWGLGRTIALDKLLSLKSVEKVPPRVLGAIAKKDTLNRLSTQFGAFTRSKKNIANATKKAKGRVIRSVTSETLKRNATLQGCGGLKVDEIGGNRHSLRSEEEERRRSSSHVPSQAGGDACAQPRHFGHGRRAENWARVLLSKKTTQQGDILTGRISPKDTYRRGKLSPEDLDEVKMISVNHIDDQDGGATAERRRWWKQQEHMERSMECGKKEHEASQAPKVPGSHGTEGQPQLGQ
ncbi:hypothetical protein QYE76_019730 [Lolium multiflorum]|uniref:F-box domain-containing protein n=1 Tax=Lolium multiflorum TaxID=4521 RepID=A0AAD8R3K1_LOLMU|nr:hypothetical protein QYE76_019730 [Lolium multiflorum]